MPPTPRELSTLERVVAFGTGLVAVLALGFVAGRVVGPDRDGTSPPTHTPSTRH